MLRVEKIVKGKIASLSLLALAIAFVGINVASPKVGAVGSSPGIYYIQQCCRNYTSVSNVYSGSTAPNKSYAPGKLVLWSASGRYTLAFQTDGNLVEYEVGGRVVWATNTHNRGATRLTFQTDGNLVIYAGNTPIWATNYYGNYMYAGNPTRMLTLMVQEDSNVVIYKGYPGNLTSAAWARTW